MGETNESAFMSLDTLVRDFCVVILGDMTQQQYVRVARAMRIVLEELHLLVIPFIQSKEFVVADNLTIPLPADAVKPLQVGKINAAGNIEAFGHEARLRRTESNDGQNPIDCDNPDHDQTTSTGQTTPAAGIVFFNFSGRGGYIGELYGLRKRAFPNGTWRWNQMMGTIELGTGTEVYAGNTLVVEYKSTFGEDIHRLVPKQWQNAINFRVLQMLTASAAVRTSQAHFHQFLREYGTIKRHMQAVSPKEVHQAVEEARYGALKW